eukprot:TRINITY_DN2202_c0_g3_i1.p1 TRINITY_DN2202_c0_g3~~TRINITY_DN2202_c0_g3_i1.p1  ORF type:complete len:383 (-),score=61.67 TRINITY_DN2202_c0_g3_i1:145-1293(-)
MRQIFSVLAYIHYEGYVHRDIKPENFVLTLNSLLPLRLANLATAVQHKNGYGFRGTVGTYFYMAPEMLMGLKYGKEVDMWSAGIIMYLLIFGAHPLVEIVEEKETVDVYKTMIKRELSKDNKSIVDMNKPEIRLKNRDMINLLRQLLQVDPKKRITAERALNDPWIIHASGLIRRKKVLEIERVIRKRKDINDVLMNVISVICAPVLKVMLLDRMCNHCKWARFGDYPEVSAELEEIYRRLFYLIDANGNGYLSKDEILHCTLPLTSTIVRDRFPNASISKTEILDMLSRVSLTSEYGVPLRTFEHAAALNDLELNRDKIENIFRAIDLVRTGNRRRMTTDTFRSLSSTPHTLVAPYLLRRWKGIMRALCDCTQTERCLRRS